VFSKLFHSALFKDSLIYTSSQVINKGLPFLLIPVLTRYLSPDDYGMVATYTSLVGLMSIVIGLSIPGAIGVNYFHLKGGEFRSYNGNAVIILFFILFLVVFVLAILNNSAVQIVEININWIYVAAFAAFFEAITMINLTLWRSQQRAKPFALYEILMTVFNIFLTLFLVVYISYAWEGRVSAMALSTIIFGVVSLIFIFRRGFLEFKFSVQHVRDILRFGIPLIPHQVAIWMRSGVDVLMIISIVGVAEGGVYSIGFQLGSIIGIFANAFNNAFSPYLYRKLKAPLLGTKIELVRLTYFYFVGILIFQIILSYFLVLLTPYLVGEDFLEAAKYIFWISLAFSFHGMYLMVVNYIFFTKKNHLVSSVTIITSVFHVFLSYLLIQYAGAIGAAYASVISFFLTFVLIWRVSNKVIPMPWFLYLKNTIWRC
jgi:O-antigen/teichoic acid export membrane protein